MTVEQFQSLKSKELKNLIAVRQIAYNDGSQLRIAKNGPFNDLMSLYKGSWHYITTYKSL